MEAIAVDRSKGSISEGELEAHIGTTVGESVITNSGQSEGED